MNLKRASVTALRINAESYFDCAELNFMDSNFSGFKSSYREALIRGSFLNIGMNNTRVEDISQMFGTCITIDKAFKFEVANSYFNNIGY